MTVTYHKKVEQRSEEWFALRCGMLTASEMKFITQPKKLEYADNETSRQHLNELLGQRITKYVEPRYRSADMERGYEDEIDARIAYHENYAKTYGAIEECGFITNDEWGFTLGYSPDFLVGANRQAECKGRLQKYQIETINSESMPDEFRIQVQTGLLVSKRDVCEFISYCGGLPMFTLAIEPDKVVQDAIIACAAKFHEKLDALMKIWIEKTTNSDLRLIPTERRIEQEMFT